MTNIKKYAVIVGATGGIGSAVAKYLVGAGYIVIATGTKQGELAKLQKRFGKKNIIPYKIDLEESKTYEKFYSFVKNKTNTIDWLIHSAGFIDKREPALKYDKEIIKKTFLINTEAVIAMTYLLLPIINDHGGIISISSTASLWGNSQYPIYSASKGALNVFGKSLARNMLKNKQSSIIICPGATNTKMRQRLAGDAKTKQDPSIIGEVTKLIVQKSKKYKNGDMIVVQDGKIKIQSRLKT